MDSPTSGSGLFGGIALGGVFSPYPWAPLDRFGLFGVLRHAKSRRWIDLVLDPDERIEDHRPAAIVEIYLKSIQGRIRECNR